MAKQIRKQKFQIIELDIQKAGSVINLSKTTETDYETITGVALFKQGGIHGNGTLGLKIDGEEIFPPGFHADIITLNSDDKNTVLKDVVWPVNKEGKGSPIQIEYKEPLDGKDGKLYLYLLAEKLEEQED